MRARFLMFVLLPAVMLAAAACGGDEAPSATPAPATPQEKTAVPSPTPTPPAPSVTEAQAPIEAVEVIAAESDPPQYFLEITSGLPNACHTFDRVTEERVGTEVAVAVINRVTTGDDGCAQIYKTERHSAPLGSDFEPGVTYTVRVNDWTTSFTPEAGAPDSGPGDAGAREVPAPIESVALNVAESYPPQYFLEIIYALPDSCHTFDRAEEQRSGREITVAVINRVATGDVACAEIYKTERLAVALGTDFEPGATYTVWVNDETLTFTTEGGAADSGNGSAADSGNGGATDSGNGGASADGDDRGQGEGDEDRGDDSTTAEVDAPIEDVVLAVAESDPPQYFLDITFGLPDACHTFDRTETQRSGTQIEVSVINRVETGDVACAQVYKTERRSAALGSDFEPGVTYTVRVNGEIVTTFTTDATGPGAPAGTEVAAPIESVVLSVAESDPPQYFLEVIYGLPNSCHTLDRVEERRSGREVTVAVINRVADGACMMIYKTERLSVALGTDFEPGATYTVRVNDQTLTFTAQ